MTFDFTVFWEVFGYMGTALVIISMLMTSVVKLRIINICGSIISMIYAIIGGAWPIVLLNGSLIVINGAQLVRMCVAKAPFQCVTTKVTDGSVSHFLTLYAEDIKRYFPQMDVEEGDEARAAYVGSEMVGLIVGKREGNELFIKLDYSTPKYRDLSVSTFLFSKLKEDGVKKLNTDMGVPERQKYLLRMGFSQQGERMIKTVSEK